MKKWLMNKRGIVSEYLPWVIIAIAVLVIMMISIWLMKDKGITVIDSFKDIFKGK